MNLFLVRPLKLEQAVSAARKLHGDVTGTSSGPGESWIDAFLRKLSRTPSAEYGRLAAELRPGELRGLIAHLPNISDPATFDALASCLFTRRRSIVAAAILGLLGNFCDRASCFGLVNHVWSDAEWRDLLPTGLSVQLPRPLEDLTNVAKAVGRAYDRSRTPWESFTKGLAPLAPRTIEREWANIPLGMHLLKEILLRTDGTVFRIESGSQISKWARSHLTRPEIGTLASRYLATLPLGNRGNEVLSMIVERLGDPRLQPESWREVLEVHQRQVIEWINTRKLEDFFLRAAGDRERFEFWKQFVQFMGPNSEGRVNSGQGFFEFPGFGVIEFMEIGNAAYLYPTNVYNMFRSLPTPSNARLKDRDLLLSTALEGDLRIIHTLGWTDRWSRIVARQIRDGQNAGRSTR